MINLVLNLKPFKCVQKMNSNFFKKFETTDY